jgi:hypothetical protein
MWSIFPKNKYCDNFFSLNSFYLCRNRQFFWAKDY